MADRYAKKYALPERLYADGAPVIIESGALLYDNAAKRHLVQLNFLCLAEKPVAFLRVLITPTGAQGDALGEGVTYLYSDLNAKRDDEFGRKAAIVIPDVSPEGFRVFVQEVGYADDSAWDGTGAAWTPMKTAQKLAEALGDEELARQYRIRYGSDCVLLPCGERGLWTCTCGAMNRDSEEKCHRCRRVYAALKNVNVGSLRSESAQRVEVERREADEEQTEKKAARKRFVIALAVLVPLIAAAIAAVLTVPRYMQEKEDYAAAQSLLAAGYYDEAEAAFDALGDYADSAEMAAKAVPYARAEYLFDCAVRDDVGGLLDIGLKRSDVAEGETVSVALYREAAARFAALGDYKDSRERAESAQKAVDEYFDAQKRAEYDAATALLDEGSFLAARDAFTALGDYADSAAMATESMYRRASALVEYVEKYFTEGIYAAFSTVTGEKSAVYIPQSVFSTYGNDISSDLRDILRGDGVEVTIADAPGEGAKPICQAVADELADLGDYADTAALTERALIAGDYTRPFYAKCAEGDIIGAYQWLSAYTGEFDMREQWLALLELYAPYCGQWELYSGDLTLIAQTSGLSHKCSAFTSKVVIADDHASLVIYPAGGEEYPIELKAALGNVGFALSTDETTTYYAIISNFGRLTYTRYSSLSAQAGNQSVEYSKTA